MTDADPVRRWKFLVTDELENEFYLSEDEFVGQSRAAHERAERLSLDWEDREGGLIVKIVLESQGKVEG